MIPSEFLYNTIWMCQSHPQIALLPQTQIFSPKGTSAATKQRLNI